MEKSRVTAQQVARRAGVSPTTVSFVLNNVERANISDATRQRVIKAAEELGYVPDAAARSLARGYNNNIALVLTQPHAQVFKDIYVPNVLTGVTQVIREKGMRILVELTDDVSHSESCLNLIRGREVAGLLVIPSNPSPEDVNVLRTASDDGFPIVSLSTLMSELYSVTISHFEGVAKVVRHLLELGHRRIACVNYSPVIGNPHASQRLQTYRDTLHEYGVPVDESLIHYGAFEAEHGYQAALALLRLPSPPTAIYAMNDVMAFGVMSALQEQKVRIPDDIAVVGYDDIPLARYTTPALTTVSAPEVEHGKRAAEILVSLIERNPPVERHEKLDTQLVIRDSCGFRQKSGGKPES